VCAGRRVGRVDRGLLRLAAVDAELAHVGSGVVGVGNLVQQIVRLQHVPVRADQLRVAEQDDLGVGSQFRPHRGERADQAGTHGTQFLIRVVDVSAAVTRVA